MDGVQLLPNWSSAALAGRYANVVDDKIIWRVSYSILRIISVLYLSDATDYLFVCECVCNVSEREHVYCELAV